MKLRGKFRRCSKTERSLQTNTSRPKDPMRVRNLYDNTANTLEPPSQKAREEITSGLVVTEGELSVKNKNLKIKGTGASKKINGTV